MNLFNEQVVNAYAIAKILGSDLSVHEFQKKYSCYFEEALAELSQNANLAKCEAMHRPY